MRISRPLGVPVLALVVLASSSSAQSLVGALAVDERQGDRWGWAVDYETTAAVRAAALRECGSGCAVVLTFARCGAYAADHGDASTAYGWAESYASADGAGQRALAECRSRGGSECLVRAWGCNGPVVEDRLRLDRAARQRIQEGLKSAGFDPGTTDGQFGPRTRAAIRNWQSASAARATGYLNNEAAEALQSPDPAASPLAQAATGASPSSSSVTAEQENLFWQSIMNSTNPADFEAYLQQFPAGVFRLLAQNRLTALRKQLARRPAVDGPRGRPAAEAADARVPTPRQSIDFGDDTSDWARDGECDDLRFYGDGMAFGLTFGNRGRDAGDCRRLYDAGRISLFGIDPNSGYIDFGDDASSWARDGECDDPRFDGAGMAPLPLARDRGHDAADCRRLYNAGRVRLFGVSTVSTGGVR